MRVLMLGGTQFFGAAIVEQLLQAGHAVSVFSRGNAQPSWWAQVEHISGDRTDPESLRNALRNRVFDVMVDNIAYTGGDVQHALDAVQGNVGRYLLTSTAGVYRFVPDRIVPVDEDDVDFDWNPPGVDPNGYQAGKRDAERVLRSQTEVPFTIIRPPIVFGPHDPSLRGYFYIQRLLDGQPLLLTNGGLSSFRLAYSHDLAGAYVLAVENERAAGRTYTVAQTEVITLHDLVQAAATALQIDPDLVAVPKEMVKVAGLEYADPYGRMVNFIPSVRRIQEELGYTSTPYRRWIGDTALWYRDTYRGDDSAGYNYRQDEVALARWYRDQVAAAANALGTQ